MTPEERAEVAPAADNFEDLFGDRSETPTSVKAADVAVGLTPVGSAVEIGEELSKEDPSYGKVAIIAAGDALGAAIPAMGPVAKSLIKQSDKVKDVWSYPEQLYDSADTSINVSKKPAGYNELKKRGEIKDGDVIVDIGGGRFDNLVEDAAEEGATVKVYDPFNRTPEHNAAVVDSVKDGQADMAMSHNVLNVIQEDKNIIDIARQAENAIKPNGKAHFSVYEGDGKGVGKVTTKGYQRNEKTQAYVPLIEQVFGEGNVTKKGKIITATKSVKGFSEGGMALEEQMSMNFGDVPDNTIGQDPVSGNDIPLGSTAENVRDDIPSMLSEGEIVVPADVVNFHGVKLFEDLRAEAKMGYAQMAKDGRIGGEPMDINDDMGMDIELSELDLEIMDDEAPVEMRRGGMSMKDYEGVTKNRDIKPPKRSGPRKTHAEIMASAFRDDDDNSSKPTEFAKSLSERVQARKNKPKTRGEALYRSMKDLFSGGDDDDKPTRNKYNLDLQFGGNLAERGARKFGTAAPSAGQVQGAYTGQQQPFNTDFEKQPFFQALVKNLKKELGMDEGGLVPDEDQHLIGGESQFNQGPYYAPDQKGGFDMENAYASYGEGGGPVIEMREYMNDEGHRIFITFIDGEPQMEIPEGYYPVGDDVVVAPEVPPVGGSGGSDDGGSGMDMPTATPVNYKELSIEELQQMVEDHKSFGSKVFAALSPLTRLAMWDQTRKTRAEIERRLADPTTSNVDRMRLEQLLDIANRDEPGLIKTLVDKITGNTLQTAAGNIPKPKIPDVDFDDPTEAGTVAAPYTPNDQEEEPTTTPGVNEKSPAQIIQDSIDIKRIEDEMKSQPRPTSDDDDDDEPFVQPSYDIIPPVDSGFGGMGPDPAEQFGGSQTRFQSSRPSRPAPKPSPIYDNVAAGDYNDDSTGVHKGALIDKPKVKKVVKGLKKASKSHAKQADQLEKAMKKKSK